MAAAVSARTRSGTRTTSSISSSAATSSNTTGGLNKMRTCVGCGGQIHDQFILQVAPNLEWHAACLKCSQCHKFLDEKCTCFVRDGLIFCKEDYNRLFGTKCEKCDRSFGANDYVMRAKNKIFHLECFRCVICDKQLVPGDEFALRPDAGLVCKDHHHLDKLRINENNFNSNPREENNNNQDQDDLDEDDDDQSQDEDKDLILDDRHDRFADSGMDDLGSEKSPCSSIGGGSSRSELVVSSSGGASLCPGDHPGTPTSSSVKGGSVHGGHQQRRSRAGRVRTVLTEKQLSLLKSCYSANPRPDALMKEQLVEMTGLSPRVVRVWFQNKRCKDKKRQMANKSKEGRKLGYSTMAGVPMVATSPMRHDMSSTTISPNGQPGIHPADIHSYEPPWKALCDFALHSDLDRPGYNHLVNEMHGYDYGRPPLGPPPGGLEVNSPYVPGGVPPPPPPGLPPHQHSQTIDPMGDPYLEGECALPPPMGGHGGLPTASTGSVGPIDNNNYTLTSLDNEA